MSITYTDWNAAPPREPYTHCAPNLGLLRDFLSSVFGGQHVGCYGVRPITGGTSWSTHAYGAAFDWRYANVGGGYREVGRDAFLDKVLPLLIWHADRLGVQQIHDYAGARIWRTGRGWRTNTTAAGMGDAWATYIHVECNAESWPNVTPLDLRGVTPAPFDLWTPDPARPELTAFYNPADPFPPFDPEAPPVNTISIDHPTLKLGAGITSPDLARHVKRVQSIIQELWASPELTCDGKFGPMTKAAVERMQRAAKLTVDGIVGPQTARVLYSS